jgi:16S rRNA (uracil1498-N3)-methyltransferase
LGSAAAHVFVADLAAPVLCEEDRHHLERVLRLRAGESVTASDGAGRWCPCVFRGGAGLEVAGEVCFIERLLPAVTVAFALTKGDRPEWTVQKLVEAGVDRIVPMTTRRSVVRWEGEKVARNLSRLRSVAVAAAMQSRQVWLPIVNDVQPFSSFSSFSSFSGAGAAGPGVAMAERGGDPPSLAFPTVLVGPEGGWDESELASGLAHVALGPTVLRAETAAVAAGLLLCALRSGIVHPAADGDAP